MSIKVMQWVWDHSEAKNAERLVLLAIADNAADDGTHAYPTIAEVQRKTRLSKRGVQEALTGLIERGELKREIWGAPGERRSNMYSIIMTPAESAPPQNLHPHPAESAPPPPQNLRGNRPSEPSDNRPPSRGDADASPESEEKTENAGDILAAFIDYCAGQGVKIPRQVIARYGREIKTLVIDDGFPPKLIKHALSLMLQRGKHTHPALLPSFVVEVQGQSRPVSAPPAASRPGYQTAAEKAEQERQRQRAIAEIADRLAEEWKVDPTDYLRNKAVTETATRIYEDKAGQIHGDESTTCSATGYSGTNGQVIVDAEWTETGPHREVTAG